MRIGSLLKETLERPFSMEKVERWEIFVRIFGGDLKRRDIVCVKYIREGRYGDIFRYLKRWLGLSRRDMPSLLTI